MMVYCKLPLGRRLKFRAVSQWDTSTDLQFSFPVGLLNGGYHAAMLLYI